MGDLRGPAFLLFHLMQKVKQWTGFITAEVRPTYKTCPCSCEWHC